MPLGSGWLRSRPGGARLTGRSSPRTGRSRTRRPARIVALAAGLGWPAALGAQSDVDAPAVLFRFEPAYQAIVSGDRGGDAGDDARWAAERAEDLTEFHAAQGERLLRLLADYAGLRWPYREISVYLVRTFPTLSIQYPLTIAVGEIRQGQGRQEVPGGDFLVLTYAHQITHYLLDPPPEALPASRPAALSHPLMQEGSYRREALVNLVTYRALRDVWGPERLRRATAEPLWSSYNPAAAFVDSLEAAWPLSVTRPLASWLAEEPPQGRLVRLAESFESRDAPAAGAAPPPPPAGAPGTIAGNDVGLDLGQTSDGRLVIAFLDPRSPADDAGLRRGDVVLTVEGREFTTVSAAMGAVREAWRLNREVNLSVERQGREVFFQIH